MEKKVYTAPEAEMIEFDYRNQVVASGCTGSPYRYTNAGGTWIEMVWNNEH